MSRQRRWTVPAPPSIKLVSTTICKIVTAMCVVVSPRSYAVRTRPRVRQQRTVKSPCLLSNAILISLYLRKIVLGSLISVIEMVHSLMFLQRQPNLHSYSIQTDLLLSPIFLRV